MASVDGKSSSKERSDSADRRFAVCVKNDGYRASLELRKLYEVLDDPFADEHGLIRVVDESGEDYLYSHTFFLRIDLPKAVAVRLKRLARPKTAA